MIFFLIGYESWKEHMARELTDRVTDIHGHVNKAYTRGEQLRGTKGPICTLITSGGYEITQADRDNMILIDYLNELVDKGLR